MGKCKFIYTIYVDSIGFGESYTVKASSRKEAFEKARKMAIKDFKSGIKCSIEDKEINY